jgi:hypothetical protein
MRGKNRVGESKSHSSYSAHSRRDGNFRRYRALAGAGSTGRKFKNSRWLLNALGKACS